MWVKNLFICKIVFCYRHIFYKTYTGVQLYLLWSVDIFVESFEGINVELHELSQQIKVAL